VDPHDPVLSHHPLRRVVGDADDELQVRRLDGARRDGREQESDPEGEEESKGLPQRSSLTQHEARQDFHGPNGLFECEQGVPLSAGRVGAVRRRDAGAEGLEPPAYGFSAREKAAAFDFEKSWRGRRRFVWGSRGRGFRNPGPPRGLASPC